MKKILIIFSAVILNTVSYAQELNPLEDKKTDIERIVSSIEEYKGEITSKQSILTVSYTHLTLPTKA